MTHTETPWAWQVHDKSMASLGVMPDPGYGTPLVLSVSPCPACTDRATEFVWGKCGTPTEDDARHIVHCVNTHDALVKALEGLLSSLDSCVDLTPEKIAAARAALALAKGHGE